MDPGEPCRDTVAPGTLPLDCGVARSCGNWWRFSYAPKYGAATVLAISNDQHLNEQSEEKFHRSGLWLPPFVHPGLQN